MKKILFLLFLVSFICIAGKPQTNVSGNITANTTWTKANSPYTLVGNVGVPSAYTLTIEPGVTVQRLNDYQLFINGAVKINGTVTDSIVFADFDKLDNLSKYFIEFQKSTLDSSSLRFVSFQNAPGDSTYYIGLNEGNKATQANANSGSFHIARSNLSHGYVEANDNQGIGNMDIDSCFIVVCHIDQQFYAEQINISNSQLYACYIPSSMTDKTNFFNCYLNGINMPQQGSFIFSDCTVENSRLGSGLFTSPPAYGFVTINNSTFRNTSLAGEETVFKIINSSFTITNKIYNLDNTESKYLISGGRIVMLNSNLADSSSYNVSGIELNQVTAAANDTINHNQFYNFYDAVTVNDFPAIKLDSNNFFTVGRYDIVNNTSQNFSALYNYFQLKDGQTIDDVIYDQKDDLSLGLVTYTPYSSGPGVLAVNLLSFAGNVVENTIKLSWQTSKDVDASSFIIERKTNNEFIPVGNVLSNSKSSITNYYFTDQAPVTGTNYYRLKMIDADGRNIYSSTVAIKYLNNERDFILYPNPASSYVFIKCAVLNNDTQLKIVDAAGKQIKTVIATKGSSQIKINLSGISKGLYKVTWQDDTKKESKTLLIQ